MAQLIVRNLAEDVKARLKQRARRHGTSLENEVRQILQNAAKEPPARGAKLGSRIAVRFAGLGLKNEIAELRGFTVQPARFDP